MSRARTPRRSRLAVLFAFAVPLLVSAGAAIAAGGGDDRAAAEAALVEVDRAAPEARALASELVARARDAQGRAAKLRASGDEAHARVADGLARTWAEAARDTLRAVALEGRANAERAAANDAGTQAERERALLEEGVAQTGRLRAQLEAVSREGKEQPTRTNAKGAGADAGAPRKPAPSAKDGGR